MSEKPIIFSTDMVKTILDDRRTVTRRVMKYQPENGQIILKKYRNYSIVADIKDDVIMWRPYGGALLQPMPYERIAEYAPFQKDDLLWVKENYCHGIEWDDTKPSEVDPLCGGNDIWYLADSSRPTEGWGKTRVARFMPKWAARIWLEVIAVRPERLQEMDTLDAIREGCASNRKIDNPLFTFMRLWDSLNAKRGYGWETNPWVWRISFRKIGGIS